MAVRPRLVSLMPPSVEPKRRRGRVHEAWTGVPLTLTTWGAGGIAMLAQLESQPHLAGATALLHVLGMFFANAYRTSWRAGLWFWQFLAFVGTVGIWLGLGWLHLQDAPPRIIYVAGEMFQRPAQPQLFVASGLLGGASVCLLLHLLVLGRGSRPAPSPKTTSPDATAPPPSPLDSV